MDEETKRALARLTYGMTQALHLLAEVLSILRPIREEREALKRATTEASSPSPWEGETANPLETIKRAKEILRDDLGTRPPIDFRVKAGPGACPDCGYTFRTAADLERAVDSVNGHTLQDPDNCPICGRTRRD